jgi:hypothetical protein
MVRFQLGSQSSGRGTAGSSSLHYSGPKDGVGPEQNQRLSPLWCEWLPWTPGALWTAWPHMAQTSQWQQSLLLLPCAWLLCMATVGGIPMSLHGANFPKSSGSREGNLKCKPLWCHGYHSYWFWTWFKKQKMNGEKGQYLNGVWQLFVWQKKAFRGSLEFPQGGSLKASQSWRGHCLTRSLWNHCNNLWGSPT